MSEFDKRYEQDNPHVKIDQGVFVRSPNFGPDVVSANGNAQQANGANAYVSYGGEKVWMWVTEVTSDFSISGTMSQSRTRRSYFPRYMSQPQIMISGQCSNSYEYNRLALFARKTQIGNVGTGGLTKFRMVNVPPKNGTRESNGAPRHHGATDIIDVDGYISMVSAGAKRFENAPNFRFTFVVADAHNFLGMQEYRGAPADLKEFIEIINDKEFKYEFLTKEEVAEVTLKPETPGGPASNTQQQQEPREPTQTELNRGAYLHRKLR